MTFFRLFDRRLSALLSWQVFRLLDDLSKRLFPDVLANLPCSESVALLEDLLDFLKRAADGFREHEEDVDEGGGVEGAEDEVCLPSDAVETRGNSEGESTVKCPVGGLGEN